MNRNEFMAIVAPVVVRVRRDGGPLFPSILMAQTLLETGGKIPEWNNIVGYKVGSGKQTKFWRGRSVNTKTREVINGVSASNQRADWRVYDSVYDYLKEHALLFKNNPERYQRVIDAPDPYTQADALYACGYATDSPKEIDGDPDYAEKLRGIIPRFEYLDVEATTVSKFKMKYEITSRFLSGPSKRRPCIPMPGVRFLGAHDTGNPGSTAAGNVSYYERSRNECAGIGPFICRRSRDH